MYVCLEPGALALADCSLQHVYIALLQQYFQLNLMLALFV